MNNTLAAETIDVIVQEAFDAYVIKLIGRSSFVLLIYTTILKFPDEMKYIWGRRFSLPTWLYIFAKYGSLIQQGLVVGYNLVPSISQRLCNILINIQFAGFVLFYTGVQGLLIVRAYSLSKGNKIIAGMLAIGFAAGLGLSAISITPYNPCSMNFTLVAEQSLATFLQSASVIFIDLVVFGVCMWEIRGIWILKTGVGLKSPSNLVSILLRQSVLRSCVVISTSVIVGVLVLIDSNSTLVVTEVLNNLQNCLSAILIADFTLELRRHNSTTNETVAANITLSIPGLQTALRNVHQSILVEMGIPEDSDIFSEGDDDDDIASSINDGETTVASA